ncbi:MAG: hypothetical protein ABOK23_13365 [Candidatus Methanoperedens sp.]|nr:hypothetical protein [Candidatus Methanoperedens sp.]
MKISIKVGVIEDTPLKNDVITEILNHQGILFKICNEKNVENHSCVISTINKDIKYKNVIYIDDDFLNDYLFALTGSLKLDEKDRIDASVVEHEIQLTEKIRNCYHGQNLPFIRKWFWPDFKQACCIITHDIDEIDRCPSRKKSKFECIKYILSHIMLKSYGDNIDTLLNIEDEKSIKSTFYLFPKYSQKSHFFNILEKIKHKGHEIGLHGSPEAALDEKDFIAEKQELQEKTGEEIIGHRQHTLTRAFLNPKTLQIINNCNLKYDISIASNEKFGFKSGICYPYHPFDMDNKSKFKFLEIPSPYMDWTGIHRNFNAKQHIEIMAELTKTVELHHGCLVLSFHNSYINKRLFPEIYETFLKTLDYVSEKNYWIATASECAEWWQKREDVEMEIYFENGKIIGNSSTKMPIRIEYINKYLDVFVK